MNTKSITNLFNNLSKEMVKRSPEILTGLGILGMGTAIIFAVKATPKAQRMIRVKKEELKVEELTKVDTIKATWKCYIPATSMFLLSAASIVASDKVSAQRCAAITTAYKLSESALTEYQEKVIEEIGKKKEQSIRDEIAKDHMEKTPVVSNEVIVTGDGDTLCLEALSKRYFKSNINKIEKVINKLNRKLISENYISLNEFYYELGLSPTKLGNDLGWNVDSGLIDVHFSSHLNEDGKPCLVIDYHIEPRYDYTSLL